MALFKKIRDYSLYLFKKSFKKNCPPYQLNSNFIIPIIKEELDKNITTILDIGCGMQYERDFDKKEDIPLACFAKKQYKVTGIDISKACIAWRKKNGPKGSYFLMNANNLNSFTQRFDIVFAHHVLEHLTKEDGLVLLKNIEKLAIKKIILGTPIGFVDTEYAVSLHNNEHERHLSGWEPKFFKKKGYKVIQDANVLVAIKTITD